MIDIQILSQPLSLQKGVDLASDPGCGGVASFIGTVRNQTADKPVLKLEYECYDSMAIKEMTKIARQAIEKFRIKNVVVQHRTGTLYPGDLAVVIVVSDGHRDAVFDACRFIIDQIKLTVPIWKKEFFADNSHWVSAHP